MTKWWFWVLLLIALPLMLALDRALTNYSRRYWRRRGQEPPRHRPSYVNASRVITYTVIAGIISGTELLHEQYVWGALLAIATVVLALLARMQARRNVI